MHFIGLDSSAQCGIDLLMPLNQALAFKAAGHNGGIPMLAVARQLDVLARQAAGDDGLEFFTSHVFIFCKPRSMFFQAGAADLALPGRRRSAPSEGRELHEVSERGGIV